MTNLKAVELDLDTGVFKLVPPATAGTAPLPVLFSPLPNTDAGREAQALVVDANFEPNNSTPKGLVVLTSAPVTITLTDPYTNFSPGFTFVVIAGADADVTVTPSGITAINDSGDPVSVAAGSWVQFSCSLSESHNWESSELAAPDTSTFGMLGTAALYDQETFAPAPTGIPDGTKFYRDDGTWAVPSGGGGVPSWSDALTALASGMVHRWDLDEGSGSTAHDSIGSLDLTLTNHTWDASPLGGGVDLATGYGVSSGLGSIPVSTHDYTVAVAFKDTLATTTEGDLCGWGGTSSGAAGGIFLNYNTNRPNVVLPYLSAASNGFISTNGNNFHGDGLWHLAMVTRAAGPTLQAIILDPVSGTNSSPIPISGTGLQISGTGNPAISNSGNFYLGAGPSARAPLTGSIGFAAVWNRALSVVEAGSLYASFFGTVN